MDEWTIVNWEKDRTYPPIAYLPRIIEFLGYDPFPNPETLGEELVAMRRHLGLSRKQIARRLGVDEGMLAIWKNDVRRPSKTRTNLVEAFLASPTRFPRR